MGFQLREGLLDRVQVGRVLRQEQQPCAMGSDDLVGVGTLVDREVVEDHHVTGLQGRSKLSFDIDIESGSIHRAGDNPGCGEFSAAQGSDEGLGTPFAERSVCFQPFAPSRPAAQTRHLGVHRSFIDEHQPAGRAAHKGLAMVDPDPAAFSYVGACAFRGHQLFFYM